jgi:hypothetical protein
MADVSQLFFGVISFCVALYLLYAFIVSVFMLSTDTGSFCATADASESEKNWFGYLLLGDPCPPPVTSLAAAQENAQSAEPPYDPACPGLLDVCQGELTTCQSGSGVTELGGGSPAVARFLSGTPVSDLSGAQVTAIHDWVTGDLTGDALSTTLLCGAGAGEAWIVGDTAYVAAGDPVSSPPWYPYPSNCAVGDTGCSEDEDRKVDVDLMNRLAIHRNPTNVNEGLQHVDGWVGPCDSDAAQSDQTAAPSCTSNLPYFVFKDGQMCKCPDNKMVNRIILHPDQRITMKCS